MKALLPRTPRPVPPATAARGEPLLSASGLSVLHGDREVVRDVQLAVHAGELVALVGPNGAGKSTLLGALSGDLAPASGTVHCHGRELREWGAGDLARRRSVLPQRVTFSFPFTVHVVVQIPQMPTYHEQVLVDKLSRKLRNDYGDPPKRTPRPAPPKDAGADATMW